MPTPQRWEENSCPFLLINVWLSPSKLVGLVAEILHLDCEQAELALRFLIHVLAADPGDAALHALSGEPSGTVGDRVADARIIGLCGLGLSGLWGCSSCAAPDEVTEGVAVRAATTQDCSSPRFATVLISISIPIAPPRAVSFL
jgi:hypothetical protein